MKLFFLSLLLVAVSAASLDFESLINDEGNGGSGLLPPEEKEMSFLEKIRSIEELMVEIIQKVHPNEKGFVPHEEFEKPGKKVAEIAVEIKKLVIEAIEPIKTIAGLAMKDIEDCNEKLKGTFMANPLVRKPGGCRAAAKQAGQCFFVVHRPFVVLLRQAMEEGLFDEPKDEKNANAKRSLVHLVYEFRKIDGLLKTYSDGKPDFPYVASALNLIKEGSEFFHRVGQAAELIIHEYESLGGKLLELIEKKESDEAQCLAGRVYLSMTRRIMKVITVLRAR